jgi:hypothetical protein
MTRETAMNRSGRCAAALLLSAAATTGHADAVDLDVSPSAPWTTTEPVTLRLTIANESDEARAYYVQFNNLDRRAHLVFDLAIVDETQIGPFHPICSDISPTPWVLTFCLSTLPIPPRTTRHYDFNVIAYPDAIGFGDGWFEVGGADGIMNTPPVRFAYGFLPEAPVPALSSVSAAMLAALFAMLGALRSRARRYDGRPQGGQP